MKLPVLNFILTFLVAQDLFDHSLCRFFFYMIAFISSSMLMLELFSMLFIKILVL